MRSRIALITNIVLEPYWHMYITNVFAPTTDIQIAFVPYEEFNDGIFNLDDADIVAVCLNFEALYPGISSGIVEEKIEYKDIQKDIIKRCNSIYSVLKTKTNTKVIWFGFEDYYYNSDNIYGTVPLINRVVDKANGMLFNMLKEDTFIDLKRLIAKVGISNAYNNTGKYRWNAPYSKDLIFLMAGELYKQYLIYTGKTKKCLVLDCDNVIWGGILSEDGIEGIQVANSGLGRTFQDFQCFLIDMFNHGVILTICSKNDQEEVLKVFREHSGMLLKEDHISFFCCNWNNKADNIKMISNSLNISLESMVFVDDSLFELEAVKSMIPEVKTILFNRNTVYQDLSCFNLQYNINIHTIKERVNTYKTDVLRDNLKKYSSSFDDYILSLDMTIDIHSTLDHEFARVSELTQRTNKCTNGTRYTLNQIKAKVVKPGYELYTVCLSDKFSNLGIVGIMGLDGQIIDLFALSCRALGRRVENEMIKYALEKGAYKVHYINISKNVELQALFRSYGVKIEENTHMANCIT